MDPKNTAEPQFSNRQIYVGFGTVLRTGKGVACDQILIDPLSREALHDSQGDLGQVNLAETKATRAGAEGRNG